MQRKKVRVNVRGKQGEYIAQDCAKVAMAVFEHRLSEITLDSTNVKGKL